MSDWHVGQRVVCVDVAGVCDRLIVSGALIKGNIYTVREVVEDQGEIGLRLREVYCVIALGQWEVTPPARRFRPLVEPHADISVFTSILDRVNKRERIDA